MSVKQKKKWGLDTLKMLRGTVLIYLHPSSPKLAQLIPRWTILAGDFSSFFLGPSRTLRCVARLGEGRAWEDGSQGLRRASE